MDVWEIYRIAYGSMGISPADIDVLAKRFDVDDPLEIHLKMSELLRESARLREESKGQEIDISDGGIHARNMGKGQG